MTGDLEAVESRLRNDRPEATTLELDRMKQRAIAQASAGGAWVPRKGLFMKPRIAVVFVLSLGLLMSGSGATLAVISDSDNAGKVQYPDLTETRGGGEKNEVGDVLGSEETSGGGGDTEGGAGGGGGGGGAEEGSGGIQEEEQIASSGNGGDLPFTGFLAIPLLVIGVMLLVAGGVMRTRTHAGSES
jgi:hypothetical protein